MTGGIYTKKSQTFMEMIFRYHSQGRDKDTPTKKIEQNFRRFITTATYIEWTGTAIQSI